MLSILQHFFRNVWIKRIPLLYPALYGINGVLEEAESRLAIIVKYGFDH